MKDPDFTRTMARKRWDATPRTLHPKQQEILALSRTQDITTMPYRKIADKVGITGPHRHNYARVHVTALQKKGLLPNWHRGKGWKPGGEQ